MKTNWEIAVLGAIFMLTIAGQCDLWALAGASQPSVLHIQQTQTTLPPNGSVPTFLAMYHVLDGAKSSVNVLALKGTLSLKNDSQNFSQVLWVLPFWQGQC